MIKTIIVSLIALGCMIAEQPAAEPEAPIQSERETLTATVTHYCACEKCNGKYSYEQGGINYTATASGKKLYDGIEGNYCAATFGEMGDVIEINGTEYIIVDRMGNRGKKGNRVDIFVPDGHAECMKMGRYKAEVCM